MRNVVSILLCALLVISVCACNNVSNENLKHGEEHSNEFEKNYSAIEYIGMTVEELSAIYGENYIEGTYQGALEITYPSLNLPYAFCVSLYDDMPMKGKQITAVSVSSNGRITNKINVGMTVDEIEEIIEFPLKIEISEMDGKYCGGFDWDGCHIILSFDSNYISTYALIKSKIYEETPKYLNDSVLQEHARSFFDTVAWKWENENGINFTSMGDVEEISRTNDTVTYVTEIKYLLRGSGDVYKLNPTVIIDRITGKVIRSGMK